MVVPSSRVKELQQYFHDHSLTDIEIVIDEAGLIAVAEHADVDVVMAAIVGAAAYCLNLQYG